LAVERATSHLVRDWDESRGMINYLSNSATLETQGKDLSDTYAQNKPWPHIVIDNFVDPAVLSKVLDEASAVRRSSYYEKFVDRKTDHNKYAFAPDVVGLETARLVNFLNSGPFIQYLESLTGIAGLIADPSYFGGGLHKIQSGGYLEMHVDFNHLKRYNLERRINLLLYLNKDWKDSYNGELELWDRPSKTKKIAISPIFNRCVIFSTTNESMHGHPVALATPKGVERMSIALYYYTNTWNPTEQAHSTLFHISQDNKVRIRPSRVYRSMMLSLIPPIVHNSVRALKQLARGEKVTSLWEK
jgi:Rps23 Pro-64 3,4-dihydroxylase Tpa1-like proline 4-hydroxylase